MGMARMAGAPVLLAGDIDRGGVFAALYGTMALLEPDERAMVKGTIINKFRGDVEILRPGLTQLEELTHVPVVGVVPWMELDLDEEDSLSQHFSARREGKPLDVAVIRLPRISNFTDFAPLERHPAVGLRYVDRVQALGRPDLVILPGTKSTLADLSWLRQSGLEGTILRLVGKGVPVIGICGGFQMLGRTLEDPQGVEGGGSMHGMGLLPVATTFSRKKSREQKCCQADLPDGFYGRLTVEGRVLGTYLHGLFDSGAFTCGLVDLLLDEKGVEWNGEQSCTEDARTFKERQYDRLADMMRRSLDMEAIYRILEQGLE